MLPTRPLALLPLAAIVAGTLAAAPPSADAATGTAPTAQTAAYRPGEIVVRFRSRTDRRVRASIARASGTRQPRAFAPRARVLRLRPGQTLAGALRALRRRPEVLSANPNYVAHASQTGWVPNDPGRAGTSGGWQQLQWNFLPGSGVNAPPAWARLGTLGRPGAKGVKIAVLDTGVAYRSQGRYRISPDLRRQNFVRGHDFVGRDRRPLDANGHGTHVASTIAQNTGNGEGLTGLAYGARIMPVRVLDRSGAGDVETIARGIRFAARKRVPIINLSFEFETGTVSSARQIPEIMSALRYAERRGSLVIGAAGNEATSPIAYPARAGRVLSVGAISEDGCQAGYSNEGSRLDLVAPGGGASATVTSDGPGCNPGGPTRDIFQVTLKGSVRRFDIPGGYQGTSMATPHVAAIAAMSIASGRLGSKPSPRALRAHLIASTRDIGPPGRDDRYGTGVIDAAKAVGATP